MYSNLHLDLNSYIIILFHPDSSSVINGSATIIISGLNCQQTYTVTAGGTVNGTLLGPRSSHGTITTGDCQIGMYRVRVT